MRTRIQKISKYTPSIFQGRLDLSSARRNFSLTVEHSVEQIFLRALLGALAILVCAYIYFVGSTIFNVIARKEAMAETANLTSVVSDLEREYFAVSHRLGPDDGTRLGLSPVSNTVYIHRPGNSASATLEINEI